jgi:hypothetical protein
LLSCSSSSCWVEIPTDSSLTPSLTHPLTPPCPQWCLSASRITMDMASPSLTITTSSSQRYSLLLTWVSEWVSVCVWECVVSLCCYATTSLHQSLHHYFTLLWCHCVCVSVIVISRRHCDTLTLSLTHSHSHVRIYHTIWIYATVDSIV